MTVTDMERHTYITLEFYNRVAPSPLYIYLFSHLFKFDISID